MPASRDAARRVALHSRKRLAIRIPKSASSARSGDEETTAKIEIYAPRSSGDDERARGSKLTSRAHDSGNTRRRRRRSRARVCNEKETTCRNFRILCMAFRRRSMPTRAVSAPRRGRIAPSPPRKLSVPPPSKSTTAARARLLVAGSHPLFLSTVRKSPGKLH